MTAGRYDFELEQGASWTLTVQWLQPGTVNIDGTDNHDGPPVDLTGWAAAMQIREYKAATAPLVSATCAVNGSLGKVTASLTREQTAAMPARTPLVYDLVVTLGDQQARLIEGDILFDRWVTHV